MEIQTQDMSRRNFVKGASALAAAAMTTAPVAALADEAAAEAEDPFDKLQEENSVDGGTEAETVNATPAHRWQSEAAAAWRTPKPTVDESLVTDGGTYDVVIVGGGQAGTWTARSCAKNGLSVAVIEGQPEDAMQYIGGEVGTINNPWALEHGATETDGQDFIREVYRRNAGRSNQRFIKDYVEHSGALLQEVIEEMGADWVEENSHVGSCPPSELMVSDPSGFKYYTGTVIFRPPSMIREAWAWNDVMHKMAQDSRDNGAVWFYSTHAEYLEKDDSGRVVSVIAKNVDDESYQRLTGTKAIVLSGGDFGGNADMLRDINDEYRNLAESLGDIELATTMPIFYERDGSAIAMGVWAGGHIEVGPHAGMNTGQVTISAPWAPARCCSTRRACASATSAPAEPRALATWPRANPRARSSRSPTPTGRTSCTRCPPCHSAVDYAHANNWPMLCDTMSQIKPGDAPGEANNQDDTYQVYCAETIEELVDMLGVWDDAQKETALAEIKRYQEYCAAGEDPDFAKDPRLLAACKLDTPPFYATVSSSTGFSAGLCQTCGLDVDASHRVVDSNIEPIPGLFALGNTSGNRFVVQYATPLAGMSLGYCLTEGTLFGERLASGEIA